MPATVPRLLAAAVLFCCASVQAQFLGADAQQRVRAATFEVVIPKPVDDPIVYEKALPLDLLPYQYRNDKYFSIGTAFAIGGHRYATAAHVFNVGIASQWGTPALRDSAGHVYPIDKLYKYSSDQDFAVFSLAQEPEVAPLETASRPPLNDPVYAVGNALGEGVVIRDGLYTSDTPEERDGRWHWLRFSAAASPGNSGGPLLDKDGKVIGIVLRKSPNENLNYALPMDDVAKAKDGVGVIDARETYQLDVFDDKQTETVHEELTLPKTYAEFNEAYQKAWYAYESRMLSELLKNNAASLFPKGEGSAELLHTIQIGEAPGLVHKEADGTWRVARPQRTTKAELPHNGLVSCGVLGANILVRMRSPDDADAGAYYSDSKNFMDLVLKGLPLNRQVGSESVKIVSLGKAAVDTSFNDSYRRVWQLREWPLAYADVWMVSLALPVPEGYVALQRQVRSAEVHEAVIDLEALADFISVSYGGTLSRWQGFLAQKALLPAAFQDIDLKIDYGKQLAFRSPRFAFSYTPDLQQITKDSDLYLDFSYFQDHGKTVWDVARIKAGEDAHSKTLVAVARHQRPSESMNDDFLSGWGKMLRRQHPYDAAETTDGDLTSIEEIVVPGLDPHSAAGAPASDSAVLYSVTVQNDGAEAQEQMKARLDQATQDLSVAEKPAGVEAAAATEPN